MNTLQHRITELRMSTLYLLVIYFSILLRCSARLLIRSLPLGGRFAFAATQQFRWQHVVLHCRQHFIEFRRFDAIVRRDFFFLLKSIRHFHYAVYVCEAFAVARCSRPIRPTHLSRSLRGKHAEKVVYAMHNAIHVLLYFCS